MNGKKRLRTGILWLAMVGLIAASTAKSTLGHQPQDEPVQALVRPGIEYIQRNFGKNSLDSELGGVCICALACFSHTGDPNHPLVKQAVESIRKELREGFPQSGHANYSLGIALILLESVDPATYRPETQGLLNEIYKRQMAGGAWSYPNWETGDTSQTQFACLGMWMSARRGIEVPTPAVEKVTNWLLRTQAPDGGFGYQGKDPGGYSRVAQERVTNSMGVAGTASLYVCAELLGIIRPARENSQTGLPPGLKPAPRRNTTGPIQTSIDANLLRNALRDGDDWCNRNAGVENRINGNVAQQYYYLYTVERYWAFRNFATSNRDPNPGWYNNGVEYLRKRVDKDGSWKGDNGPEIDTAFGGIL